LSFVSLKIDDFLTRSLHRILLTLWKNGRHRGPLQTPVDRASPRSPVSGLSTQLQVKHRCMLHGDGSRSVAPRSLTAIIENFRSRPPWTHFRRHFGPWTYRHVIVQGWRRFCVSLPSSSPTGDRINYSVRRVDSRCRCRQNAGARRSRSPTGSGWDAALVTSLSYGASSDPPRCLRR